MWRIKKRYEVFGRGAADMVSPEDTAMAELETVEEEEVLRRLGTNETTGLTEEEAARRLRVCGPNVVILSHHEDSGLHTVLMGLFLLWGWQHVFPESKNIVRVMLNSMSWMTILATIVSLSFASVDQRSCGLAIVISLLTTSLTVCFIANFVTEFANAPLEAKAFMPRAKVLRDGRWRDEHAANLVPGDIIFLKCGDIVPANARVLQFQKVETKTYWAKKSVECVHSFLINYAWTVSYGQGTALVIATGHGIPRSTLRLYPQRFARPGQLREGVMAAGSFCFSLILVGTITEVVVRLLFRGHGSEDMLHNCHFMLLIGAIPMAMPAVLYLALAFGSLRLSWLGIASRGTVALEDLASMDVMLFNMTGTLTCNKPHFDRDKIEVFADGVDKESIILLAARASRAHHELYMGPIDAAILDLLDDPEQARAGVHVLEPHVHFFVALKLMFLTTYIDVNGSKCCVFKGDPAKVAHQCGCSKEVKEHICMLMDKLALDGYQAIAVGLRVNSCWEFIGLLPFRDDLRGDSAEAVDRLIDMGLGVRVLTDSPLSVTKQVCGRLGKLGMNVLSANSLFELAHNNKDVYLNTSGISDLLPEDYSDVVRILRTSFGHRCATVGYEFSDHDAISESNIAISAGDATDYTKSESDLVLTQHALMPVSSAVQISRDICQMMKSYTVYAVSSTVHLFGVHVILLIWNFELSCFMILVIAAFNYCMSFMMLFERIKLYQSPDRWRVKKIIATGAAFGSYIVLSTAIFFRTATKTGFFSYKFKAGALMGSDDEIRSALFLQISIVNQAVGLFAQCTNGCSIERPGPLVTSSFIFTQTVATRVAVHGDLNFALAKGVGWVRAGLIWLYNFLLLFTPVLICHKWNLIKITSKKLLTICMHSSILRIVVLWSLYVTLGKKKLPECIFLAS